VALTATELGCFMVVPFTQAAEAALRELPGVAEVQVVTRADPNWSEQRMSAGYRRKLELARSGRRQLLPATRVTR
jgi:metal-sulfur cluster biosynthetic enzyme